MRATGGKLPKGRRSGPSQVLNRVLPSSAQRLHQVDRRSELLAANLHGAEFDVQLGAFGRGDLEIGDEAVAVTVVGDLQLFAGRKQRLFSA